ncbi:MAG: hypothetical protein LBD90_03590 [Bifidobacteriaceae bacterium]|jgi:hypothetical protein|nr:hypothetical protein [Bifidobacteriaceae bacterium]
MDLYLIAADGTGMPFALLTREGELVFDPEGHPAQAGARERAAQWDAAKAAGESWEAFARRFAADTRNSYRERWFAQTASAWTTDPDGGPLPRAASLKTILWSLQSDQADIEDATDAEFDDDYDL